MYVMIAPNAFKNSLTAEDAAEYIKTGLMQSALDCTCECFPIADGGDGTGELIIKKLAGRNIHAKFSDPFGKKINASFGLIDNGKTAIIEMAAASGIRLLNKDGLNPMIASSAGTGEMVSAALDAGAEKITIALGGSATVDGGCGILHSLGVRFLDDGGNELLPQPKHLLRIDSIDISGLDARIKSSSIELLCDVRNTLSGPSGAAAMFGPQKGASEEQVVLLERFLDKLKRITLEMTGINASEITSGGAAGGTAAFLHIFLNAKLVSGIDRFLEMTGFEASLLRADLVITGEGEIDVQTIQGKGPFGVAAIAAKKNIPVIALAGKVPVDNRPELNKVFPVLLSIAHQPLSLEESIRLTGPNLVRTSYAIGNILAMVNK